MIVSGMIWFGSCVGSIISPFFYFQSEAPSYRTGIGSLLTANVVEFLLFFVLRYAFKWENRRKEKQRADMRERGVAIDSPEGLNATAFKDLTDKQNPNFVYVY
jgi:hypothetical protein